MYLRFVTLKNHATSMKPTGVFAALYELEQRGMLEAHELKWFRIVVSWFNDNLRPPDLSVHGKRGVNEDRAVCWLRSTAVEHIGRMHQLCALLAHKDIATEIIRTAKPGYIVYEDDVQVAAVPFD